MGANGQLLNYINGEWRQSEASEMLDVINPATNEALTAVPLSPAAEIDAATAAATAAHDKWKRVPVGERIQYLFKFKTLLDENIDRLARAITHECGKTFAESKGEIRRGIENVEVACGAPIMMQGRNNEDIARGIDEHMIRQSIGVVAAITPFNFPVMIPLWFLPYAVATGNCFIHKPSEKVPMNTQILFELIEEAGFPKGVVQLVNGGKETVNAILDHPDIRAISFVGSSAVAKYIYSRATANGKRAQCQGGAKNPVVIMPDADMDTTINIMADAAFGCAGQRCLSIATAITVGNARAAIAEGMSEAAASYKLGFGLDEGTQMGPVITPESKIRIEGLIAQGEAEGAKVLVDGRNQTISGYENGNFVSPTLLENVSPDGSLAHTEIFGPVLSLTHANTVEDALKIVNDRNYGNGASIFTRNGATARQFRYEADAGNIGINVAVPAAMAYFPFSGWNDSFYGDLHAQGAHAIEFYTQTKVIVERWPQEWSRKF